MDAPAAAKSIRINHWLPYWAVFQADVRSVLRNWVYRTWVLVSVLVAAGHLVYHLGVYNETQVIQLASDLMSNLLRLTVLGSVTLIIILTAGSISAERGTLADSVLSRGISRYQYFCAKWHARVATVLATFFFMGGVTLVCSYFFLQEDLSLAGSIIALLSVGFLLMTVASCGVAFSAIANSTMMGIMFLWMFLYGLGFVLYMVPTHFPSPERLLQRLPFILQGQYDWNGLGQLALWSTGFSCGVALIGMLYFSRRDV